MVSGGAVVEAWQYDAVVSDGAWHGVELRLARDSLQLGVDSSILTRSLQQPVRTGRWREFTRASNEGPHDGSLLGPSPSWERLLKSSRTFV